MSAMPAWQLSETSAIHRRRTGDICGAIQDIKQAIETTKTDMTLTEKTSVMYNYLSDMYFELLDYDNAFLYATKSIEILASVPSIIYADNLMKLAEVITARGQANEALLLLSRARDMYYSQGHPYGARQAQAAIDALSQ